MLVLRGGAVSYERGPPVRTGTGLDRELVAHGHQVVGDGLQIRSIIDVHTLQQLVHTLQLRVQTLYYIYHSPGTNPLGRVRTGGRTTGVPRS